MHGHDHHRPELREQDLRGLSRRELLRRSGLATGAMLLGGAGTGFSAPPRGALRGPVGSPGADRGSRIPASVGTRLVHADMHNHTLLSDGDGDAANAFGLMRDRGLDVAALTDHTVGDAVAPGDEEACDGEGLGLPTGEVPELGQRYDHSCGRVIGMNAAGWQYAAELAEAANDPANGFVAVRGFEWSATVQGHVNVWFSERYTDPTLTAGQVAVEGLPGFMADEGGPNPLSQALFPAVRRSPAPGMEGLYRWLAQDPATPGVGGGLDGIAGFNHPGREPGRFGQFGHLAGASDRIVSIEVMNRDDDFLFEGVAYGDTSPIQQALQQGWRLGLLGVTDEHGEDAWGRDVNDTRKGRAGIWVRSDLPFGRDAVKEAMTARRFFATNKSGLRLDLQATSMVTMQSVRMGQTLPHAAGTVVFDLDLDGISGEDWAGSKPLVLQVLRPGSGALPEVALERPFVVPAPGAAPLRFDVPLDVADGDWVVVRVSDPAETQFGAERSAFAAHPEAAAFAPWGRAVAYASPVWLDPDADVAAEAMRRERVAGLR